MVILKCFILITSVMKCRFIKLLCWGSSVQMPCLKYSTGLFITTLFKKRKGCLVSLSPPNSFPAMVFQKDKPSDLLLSIFIKVANILFFDNFK